MKIKAVIIEVYSFLILIFMNDNYLETYNEKIVRIDLNANRNRTSVYTIDKEYSWMLIPPLSCKVDVFTGYIKEKKGVVNTEIKLRVVLKNKYGEIIINDYNNPKPFKFNVSDYVSFYFIYNNIKNDINFFIFFEDEKLLQISTIRREKARNGLVYCEIMNAERYANAYDVFEVYRQSKKILVAENFSELAKELAIKLDIMLLKKYPISVNTNIKDMQFIFN